MIGEKVDYVGKVLSRVTEEHNNALREIEEDFERIAKEAKEKVREAIERVRLELSQ